MGVGQTLFSRVHPLTQADMAMSQALNLVADLKLGWYTSIPPREMFACQILGTIIGALTNCE
jgi:hypothetical protein